MKKKAACFLGTLALMFTLGVTATRAQDRVVAHVPFAFSVGTTELPAGEYKLTKLSQTNWAIGNDGGNASVLTIVTPGSVSETQTDGKLIFKQYGDRYFLYQISRAGVTVNVPRSKLERELAHRNASPTHVTVAARQ